MACFHQNKGEDLTKLGNSFLSIKQFVMLPLSIATRAGEYAQFEKFWAQNIFINFLAELDHWTFRKRRREGRKSEVKRIKFGAWRTHTLLVVGIMFCILRIHTHLTAYHTAENIVSKMCVNCIFCILRIHTHLTA